MKRLIFALLACLLGSDRGAAQSISVPADAKFVVQVDVRSFCDTSLGRRIVAATQQLAKQEFAHEDPELMRKVEEALGFNPLTEVRTLTIIGDDYDRPERHLRMAVQLGQTTGNLEGLMLAAPGYQSEKSSGYTVHSVQERDLEAHAAIHTGPDGNKILLIATNRSSLAEMLQDAGEPSDDRPQLDWNVPQGTFAQVRVLQFPEEVYRHDPPGNLAKMIRELSVTLSEAGDSFAVNVSLGADDAQRAEQFQQLAQGAKAFVSLFEEEIKNDKDAQVLMSLLDRVQVEREQNTVRIELLIPQDLVIQFLREEAELPL